MIMTNITRLTIYIIARALKFLRHRDLVHRDIKPQVLNTPIQHFLSH